jgi:hypothetical protein
MYDTGLSEQVFIFLGKAVSHNLSLILKVTKFLDSTKANVRQRNKMYGKDKSMDKYCFTKERQTAWNSKYSFFFFW